MAGVEGDDVGRSAGHDAGELLARGLGPAAERAGEKTGTSRPARRRRQNVAGARAQPLAIFQKAQFLGGLDLAVGVRAHAEPAAGPRVSAAVMWVACTRHHPSSIFAWLSSQSTGRCPHQARQSSTSRVCSAIWMWIGRPRASEATASKPSGVTARRLCGAAPRLPSERVATAAALASNNRAKPSIVLRNRRWLAAGGPPPNPPWA